MVTISERRSAAFLALALLAAPLAAQLPDTADASTAAAITDGHLAACASCHGEQGEGRRGAEYFPHLAGKPAGYLAEQLRGFRDGRRANPVMTWMVQFADDRYIDAVARHYAAKPARERPADTTAAPLQAGDETLARTLVESGRDGVPACSACHGANLEGTEPGIPGLVGLPTDYVIAQIGAWQAGTRASAAPDCMGEVARALRQDEVRALAGWLARQSHAAGLKPRAKTRTPIPCGVMERAP